MIKLRIGCRTCQKNPVVTNLSSNNYLELPKENLSGNMILSHSPCLTWKFFIVWFHKILKLIFHKEPLYPKNISAEHWRKLPNLTALSEMFLYFQNDDSVEHVQIAVLNLLFSYFQSEIKISHRSGSFDFFFVLIQFRHFLF